MSYAPATLVSLANFWREHEGYNLGIVGDSSHQQKGVSYHLGLDHLTANAYSRQTTRDRRGLSNAASAIDLGKLDDSIGDLRAFSSWLVTRCRANAPGTKDIREIIYSPDGRRILRYDRERGYRSAPVQEPQLDRGHLWHTHISYYRDAEYRDKRLAFRGYFTSTEPDIEPPDTSTGDTMGVLFEPVQGEAGTFKFSQKGNLIDVASEAFVAVPKGYVRNTYCQVRMTGALYPGHTGYLSTKDDRAVIALDTQGDYTPDTTVDCSSAIAADRRDAYIAYRED